MFGWLNSIKEKSKEVVSIYKNELTNMVYQLDEDIKTLKSNINKKNEEEEEQAKEQEMSNIKQSQGEQIKSEQEKKLQQKKNIIALLDILSEYDKNIQNTEDNIDFLVEQIDFIENSIDTYFSKDPKQLVMIERDDFTNFHVFEELPNIEQQAAKLLATNVFQKLPKDQQIQKRFHEKIQYSIEQNLQSNEQKPIEKNRSVENHEQDDDNNNQQFLKESENANIISQDSIEESEDGSNTKISHRKGSSPKSNLEDDNWEIDDKMIAI